MINISTNVSSKDISFDLSNKFIGKSLKINRGENIVTDDLLERYIAINNLDMSSLYRKYFFMLKQLNVCDHDPYYHLIPELGGKQYLENFKNLIIGKDISSYYFNVLSKRYMLTDYVKDAVYDHSNSVTGRMKITSGKNYLTLKKEERKDIKIDETKSLIEIDVKSCEPALLHAVLYNETPEDIYEIFGAEGVERNKVKIAVISSIYGSSIRRVKNITGLPESTIRKIHDHFQLKKIKNEVESEYEKQGYFCNMYGRPIYEISSPVNYWLQSSAADYCCLAFLNLVKRAELKVVACIHDAILVEVSSAQEKVLSKLSRIFDPISNIYLKIEHTKIK